MASNHEEELDLEAQEKMRKEMEDLQLQQKRMKSLVDQRRQERVDMEKELMRMERMKKHMETMCKENEDVAQEEKRLEDAKKPFSGKGFTLGSPLSQPSSSTCSRPIVPPPLPVEINPALPTTNIQVISYASIRFCF